MAIDGTEAAGRIAAFLDGAMVVVTASDGDDHGGCLVGFHTQASIEPWRHLVCISVANHTARVAARASHLGVHLLGDADLALAERFGGVTDDAVPDKFAGVRWHVGPEGAPILDGCQGGWFVGRILDRLPLGDHHGMLLEPVAVSDGPDDETPVVAEGTDEEGPVQARRPLRFGAVRHLEPGHPA